MAYGDLIKFYRHRKCMSQQQLGEAIGGNSTAAQQRISRYERNLQTPRWDTLERIARALDIPVSALSPSLAPEAKNTSFHALSQQVAQIFSEPDLLRKKAHWLCERIMNGEREAYERIDGGCYLRLEVLSLIDEFDQNDQPSFSRFLLRVHLIRDGEPLEAQFTREWFPDGYRAWQP